MYCFDTDVLSATMRRDPPLALIRRLALVPPAQQHTTAITIGELVYGAVRAARDDLADRIRAMVDEAVIVLPFDEAAATVYGRLRVELERAGLPLAGPDLRIASIALAHGMTLVTGNGKHFERVPSLRVENWLN